MHIKSIMDDFAIIATNLYNKLNDIKDINIREEYRDSLERAIREKYTHLLKNIETCINDQIKTETSRAELHNKQEQPRPTDMRAVITMCIRDIIPNDYDKLLGEEIPYVIRNIVEVDRVVVQENTPGNTRQGNRNYRAFMPVFREIRYMTEELVNLFKRKKAQVRAPPQSGKSAFIIARALYSVIDGKTPIIVLRDITGDLNQLMTRLIGQLKRISDFAEEYKFEYTDKIEVLRNLSSETFTTALAGNLARIVVCLGNDTQLGKIVEKTRNHESTFDLIVDENDHVDYGSGPTAELLGILKNRAHQFIGISATSMVPIMKEREFDAESQFVLSVPDDYRGFDQIVYKELPENNVYSLSSKNVEFEDMLENDGNMLDFFNEFLTKPPVMRRDGAKMPNILLVKVTRYVSSQINLRDGLIGTFPNDKFAVIVYNGCGVSIYHPDLPDTFAIGKHILEKGAYNKNVHVTNALQYFIDNGGYTKYPHIVIISGDLAARGISFVSTDYQWHLTEMYYIPCESTSIPELIQAAGRLCGRNKNGSITLILHSTAKVIKNLYKGSKLLEELISRSIEMNIANRPLSQIIPTIPINKQKIPVGNHKLVSEKAKLLKTKLAYTKENDEGWTLDEYSHKTFAQYQAEQAAIMRRINPDLAPEPEEELDEYPEQEYSRLSKLFKKWFENDCAMARFIRELNPDKIYSKPEISALCNIHDKRLVLFTGKNRVRDYYIIYANQNLGQYKLHPALRTLYAEYFE